MFVLNRCSVNFSRDDKTEQQERETNNVVNRSQRHKTHFTALCYHKIESRHSTFVDSDNESDRIFTENQKYDVHNEHYITINTMDDEYHLWNEVFREQNKRCFHKNQSGRFVELCRFECHRFGLFSVTIHGIEIRSDVIFYVVTKTR